MSTHTERFPWKTPAGRSAQMPDLDGQIICGRPGDFMTVRRLRIRGTNFEIGRTLGMVARERYGQSAEMYRTDPICGRARRHYFRRNYSLHWQRMRGVAAAFGIDPEDDGFDLSSLGYNLGLPLSSTCCSAVYIPPSLTATGHGYLSRNLDFPTGSLADLLQFPLPPEDKARQCPVFCEPYLMEWYPQDGGYPSIAIQAIDLLGGTFDGMNSAGLVVAILADVEAVVGPNSGPWPLHALGLHNLQEMRLLLDTCATVDEARETLRALREVYALLPAHCIVADRTGRSFVYEQSAGRNAQEIIEGTGEPQIVSNFALHRHPTGDLAFNAELTPQTDAFWRYRKLSELVAAHRRPFTADDLKVLHAQVSYPRIFQFMTVDAPGQSPRGVDPPAGSQLRTLWHSLYDQQSGTVEVRFYLGDELTNDGHIEARRSDYFTFALKDERPRVS